MLLDINILKFIKLYAYEYNSLYLLKINAKAYNRTSPTIGTNNYNAACIGL
jgi:hypothetical protein